MQSIVYTILTSSKAVYNKLNREIIKVLVTTQKGNTEGDSFFFLT